ncbi:MAG: T9SS type A sorting domain-containing protein [Flavobacteriales bacterium]|nr:T9SS type A sorting domain-containing protein [Flavobacteriales bacterium]MCB9173587.1 T9SS type A sorting domain-containing protein [Flavobacteriales bacterium]
MKYSILTLLVIFTYSSGSCQWPYTVISTTSPFNNLTSPISLNNNNVWTVDSTYTIPISNFNFEINGTPINSIQVVAARGISFNNNVFILNGYWTVVGGSNGSLLIDKGTSSSLSPINYELSGTPGNQIMKIEWLNAGFVSWFNTDPSTFASYQIWLFENDKHIEIHYGPTNTNQVLFPYQGVFVSFKCYGNYGVYICSNQSIPNSYWVDMTQPSYCALTGSPDAGRVFNISQNPLFTGINHTNILSNYTICPNPFKNNFVLKTKDLVNGHFQIFDIKGKELINEPIHEINTIINLSNFSSGIYFIKIRDEKNHLEYYKLFKE